MWSRVFSCAVFCSEYVLFVSQRRKACEPRVTPLRGNNSKRQYGGFLWHTTKGWSRKKINFNQGGLEARIHQRVFLMSGALIPLPFSICDEKEFLKEWKKIRASCLFKKNLCESFSNRVHFYSFSNEKCVNIINWVQALKFTFVFYILFFLLFF